MISLKPEYWSKSLWNVMYVTAYIYPENPTQEKKDQVLILFACLYNSIACEKCRTHYLNYIYQNPLIRAVENRNNLLQWVNELDKQVNQHNVDLHDKIKEMDRFNPDIKPHVYNNIIPYRKPQNAEENHKSKFMTYGIRKQDRQPRFNKASCASCQQNNT